MINLVCLLEEPSAAEMLKGILPRLFSNPINLITIPFEGKQDLEKQLTRKLRHWRLPNSVFLVMRDQDAGDCVVIKERLTDKVALAGRRNETLVRIACRELDIGESFLLGKTNGRPNQIQNSVPNKPPTKPQQTSNKPPTNFQQTSNKLCRAVVYLPPSSVCGRG